MLVRIRLTKKWAERVGAKRQRTFDFKPGVNLLVGPNGAGKSTVIEAIMKHTSKWENDRKKAQKEVPMETSAPIGVAKFDFEKDNPRTMGYFGNSMAFQIGSKWKSHGEVNRVLIGGFDDDLLEDKLVILDEPDQALDFDGAALLLEKLKASQSPQMIVSVHHPLLVCSSDFHVIELEEGYAGRVYAAMFNLIHDTEQKARWAMEEEADEYEQGTLDL